MVGWKEWSTAINRILITSSSCTLRNAAMENSAILSSIVANKIPILVLIISFLDKIASLILNAKAIPVTEFAKAGPLKISALNTMIATQDFFAIKCAICVNIKSKRLKSAQPHQNVRTIWLVRTTSALDMAQYSIFNHQMTNWLAEVALLDQILTVKQSVCQLLRSSVIVDQTINAVLHKILVIMSLAHLLMRSLLRNNVHVGSILKVLATALIFTQLLTQHYSLKWPKDLLIIATLWIGMIFMNVSKRIRTQMKMKSSWKISL